MTDPHNISSAGRVVRWLRGPWCSVALAVYMAALAFGVVDLGSGLLRGLAFFGLIVFGLEAAYRFTYGRLRSNGASLYEGMLLHGMNNADGWTLQLPKLSLTRLVGGYQMHRLVRRGWVTPAGADKWALTPTGRQVVERWGDDQDVDA